MSSTTPPTSQPSTVSTSSTAVPPSPPNPSQPLTEAEILKHLLEYASKRFESGERAETAINTKIYYGLPASGVVFAACINALNSLKEAPDTVEICTWIAVPLFVITVALLLLAYVTRKMCIGVNVDEIWDDYDANPSVDLYKYTYSTVLSNYKENEKIASARGLLFNLAALGLFGLVLLWGVECLLAANSLQTKDADNHERQQANISGPHATPPGPEPGPTSGSKSGSSPTHSPTGKNPQELGERHGNEKEDSEAGDKEEDKPKEGGEKADGEEKSRQKNEEEGRKARRGGKEEQGSPNAARRQDP